MIIDICHAAHVTRDAPLYECRLGGTTAVPQDATAFTLGRSAPHANFFAVRQGELKACTSNPALPANLLRDFRLLLGLGVENCRVQTSACPQHSPFQFVS